MTVVHWKGGGTMVARHSSRLRHSSELGSRLPVLALIVGIILAVGVLVYLALPKVHIARTGPGITDVSLGGLYPRVRAARMQVGGRSIPLVYREGALVPQFRLTPNASGRVNFTVTGPGFLGFLPWDSRKIELSATTPERPQLLRQIIHRPLGPGLTVAFRQAVDRVQYQVPGGRVHRVLLSSPVHSVYLPLAAAGPGSNGVVTVWAQSRTWEHAGSELSVRWVSIPYITVQEAAATVSPTGQLTMQFSQAIKTPHMSNWVVAPSDPGHWTQLSATKFSFTPTQPGGYGPGALVQVTIPGGAKGPQAQNGSVLQANAVLRWTTPAGSLLRLQQLLAQEGYLPVSWTSANPVSQPSLSYENSTIYNPPQGQFHWLFPNLPSQLSAQWFPGQMSQVTKGAIMQFEAVNGLPVDGIAGPEVWNTLIQDRLSGKTNPQPYSYISVTENQPETLELWVGNKLTLTTKTNTGIPATPTYLGTFPVYERLKFQVMRGKNPNGVPYADNVYWIDYFKGGDAVHGFVRASYGFPQSLGCVEVPPAVAKTIFDSVNYGTLVTVNPVGVSPAPAH